MFLMKSYINNKFFSIIKLSSFLILPVMSVQSADLAEQQQIHQEQQQKAREELLSPPTPDVRFEIQTDSSGKMNFPNESPCFLITQVVIDNIHMVPAWLRLQSIADKGKNRCLGSTGINQLMSALQNRLIDAGYVTSRILAPEQDLIPGKLKLLLIAGKVNNIQLSPTSDSYLTLFNTLPMHQGNLLNLRDLEQGLENLQRIPTAQTNIELIPADNAGESDVNVSWQQERLWRLAASFDDSGTKSTEKYQGGLTFYLDNPTSLGDMFYISGSHDTKGSGEKGTKNYTVNYTIPFGYWSLSGTLSGYDYHQTVPSNITNYQYSGRSRNQTLRLNRILYRNAAMKIGAFYEISRRKSQNFIEDTEIDLQHRETAFWKLGLTYRHYFTFATFDSSIDYQRGTHWFGAQPVPEEKTKEDTGLTKIVHFSTTLAVPFTLFNQSFNYSTQYKRQVAQTPLTSQDRFSIGGRWSVRGFDGELNLTADNGWAIRNDLSWFTPFKGRQIYLGADYGEVNGKHSSYLVGKHLAGGVIGMKGLIPQINLYYDLFIGRSFSKPAEFKTDKKTTGFNLFWEY